ncbi:unnamed protein product [Amaranthus hypochondriacus]
MVLSNRESDVGFNVPRAPRSKRKRDFPPKTHIVGEVRAFEMLAIVAGKFSEAREYSYASCTAAVKFKKCGIDKDKVSPHDEHGKSEGSVLSFGLQKGVFKGTNFENIISTYKPLPATTNSPNSCSKLQNTTNTFKKPTIVKDRDLPKEYENFNTGVFRSQRNLRLKKPRLIDRNSVTFDEGIGCESLSKSPEKGIDDEKNGSAGKLHKVQLSIKSFKVPEVIIEVTESTTIATLKEIVLEDVKTLLGGGLCVDILFQGKKIRDDNKTLLQSGISQSHNMDTVEFVLEPHISTELSTPLCPPEIPAPFRFDSPKFDESLANNIYDRFSSDTPNKSSITDSNRASGSVMDLVPSLAAELANKKVYNSKTIVPVLEASMEPLAVVPANHRSKGDDIGHRRTRRPFSVFEVEALVQAVEKLGTGRWRDVKLYAFEKAKHRTYVDLKDKWKTLVHTATISPKQRRGEPVPQELLDRVLAAHSYWSDHQAKQHGK